MTKIVNIHSSIDERISVIEGSGKEGYSIFLDGKEVPYLIMLEHPDVNLVKLGLDGRFEIDIPREYAKNVAWMICNAHTIDPLLE